MRRNTSKTELTRLVDPLRLVLVTCQPVAVFRLKVFRLVKNQLEFTQETQVYLHCSHERATITGWAKRILRHSSFRFRCRGSPTRTVHRRLHHQPYRSILSGCGPPLPRPNPNHIQSTFIITLHCFICVFGRPVRKYGCLYDATNLWFSTAAKPLMAGVWLTEMLCGPLSRQQNANRLVSLWKRLRTMHV